MIYKASPLCKVCIKKIKALQKSPDFAELCNWFINQPKLCNPLSKVCIKKIKAL
jgi:hypothetical protein